MSECLGVCVSIQSVSVYDGFPASLTFVSLEQFLLLWFVLNQLCDHEQKRFKLVHHHKKINKSKIKVIKVQNKSLDRNQVIPPIRNESLFEIEIHPNCISHTLENPLHMESVAAKYSSLRLH